MMITLMTVADDGRIVEVRSVNEDEVGLFPGATVVDDHAELFNSTHYINGEFLRVEPEIPWSMKRRSEYPPLEDFADAMYWLNQGDPTKLDAYLARVEAVKAKYPKP